jgi:VIT1/CCC1 family predicted Fe2+/Mn2+ transporter
MEKEIDNQLLIAQKNEITEHLVYHRLAKAVKDPHNSEILDRIADEEQEHYNFWKEYTKKEVRPNRWQIFKFFWISRIFGITFGIKLMERGEEQAQVDYERIADAIPEAKKIVDEEDRHEHQLIEMVEEERLQYIGSVVLGLNDALVELTGTLAGLTFALQNTRLVALAGLITGIAASFSMAASEYLSTKSEESVRSAVRSSLYTGVAYILTVFLLIFPYLVFQNYFLCLGLTIIIAILIILVFNFYISVAKDLSFTRRFTEMASISLGIAVLSFGIGYLIRIFLGIDI